MASDGRGGAPRPRAGGTIGGITVAGKFESKSIAKDE